MNDDLGKSPFIQSSPLPVLARKQAGSLEAVLQQLQNDSRASSSRDRRMCRVNITTLVVAIATLIVAIITLIH